MKQKASLAYIFAAVILASTTSACGSFISGEQTAPTDFRVRVGLYTRSGLEVARGVEAQLKEAGYRAYIRRINSDSNALYVGRNLDEEEARKLKHRLDRELDTKTLVVAM